MDTRIQKCTFDRIWRNYAYSKLKVVYPLCHQAKENVTPNSMVLPVKECKTGALLCKMPICAVFFTAVVNVDITYM